MATDKPRKTDILTPLRDGEFWRITGIAEATEKRLHAAGIQTFRQLAESSPDEIAAALQGQVGVKERAARQDWTGQADRLAESVPQEDPPVEEPV
jgi:predicted flap endonuclease-1-like 5' DNA nuclease